MLSDFFFRKMIARDLDRIMEIEKESFSLPWSRESYEGETKNRFATYLVCEVGDKIAAFGGIWVVFEEAHITNVAVAADYRNQGIGTQLMKALENVAREKKATSILLEVRPSNEAALKMYKNLSYEPKGLRKAYYADNGEDAIIMLRLLF